MYVKVTNGTATEYSIDKLKKDNPSVSFPETISGATFATYNVYPAKVTAIPDYNDLTQYAEMSGYELVEGVWKQKWVIKERPDAADSVRRHRNRLLAETDWVFIKAQETGDTLPTELAVYRQALRDLTAQEGFPHTVTWPVKPE